MNKNTKGKPFSIDCTINGLSETIRFSPYAMDSERMVFDIEQEYGLDETGEISKDYVPFAQGSTEALLIEAIRSGDMNSITDAGLILCERPKRGNISRNLPVYEPKTGVLYTIGGLGTITPTDDHTYFVLKDPMLDKEFGAYQKKRGNPVGGTTYVTEEGFKSSINKSTVGTLEYNTGPYHAVRKVLENEKLGKLGLNTPKFIAAGPIKNMADSKFGFTIYKSNLTPEYLLNVHLFVDQRGNFKPSYLEYLKSKYSQIKLLHDEIGESHGQPSVGNTLAEVDIKQTQNNLSCQVKDFETNHPIPKNTKKIIEDGLAQVDVGYHCIKSPNAAARICDLQISLMQELNVIFLPVKSIEHPQKKFDYITTQSGHVLNAVSQIYNISSQAEAHQAINFAMQRFFDAVKKGHGFDHYNEIIAGAFVHKWLATSSQYGDQVEIRHG